MAGLLMGNRGSYRWKSGSPLILALEPQPAAERSAADIAFGIIELLEDVISHLPCKDVLLAQRVSRTWRDTIKGSLTLQKALCFVPVNVSLPEREDPLPPEASIPFWWGPKHEGWSARYPTLDASPSARDFYERSSRPGAYVLNPLITQLCPQAYHSCHAYGNRIVLEFDSRSPMSASDLSIGSWKAMQITQPPSKDILLVHQNNWLSHVRYGRSATGTTLVNEEGITIADVIDTVGDCWENDMTSIEFMWQT